MTQGPLKLWEHQTRIVGLTEEILREQTSLLVAAPTGSGKTICLSEISAMELRRDRKIGLLVHRQELVSQSEEKIIRQTGIKPGVVWQSRREWEQPITIMAQDTISGLEIPPR